MKFSMWMQLFVVLAFSDKMVNLQAAEMCFLCVLINMLMLSE